MSPDQGCHLGSRSQFQENKKPVPGSRNDTPAADFDKDLSRIFALNEQDL